MLVSNRLGLQPYWQSECGRAVVYVGDNIDIMSRMEPAQFHAVVTDPPYGLEFDVGQVKGDWDSCGDGKGFQSWFDARATEMLRVAKPGAHLLSFGGTRMWHRMACGIEDAGWEMRDTMMWLYSSGYPKGRDVSKDIDKILGAKREVVGRVEMIDTTKIRPGFTGEAHAGANVGSKRYVDLTVPATDAAKQWEGWNTTLKPAWEPIVVARKPFPVGSTAQNVLDYGCGGINVDACRVGENDDLWPANLLTDGADEQLCRYFYCPKSNDGDRPHGEGSTAHPTVKPLELMRYLVRLVCARGSWILDPFSGSFSTGCAALIEGMNFVGIEQSVDYADIGVGRMKLALQSAPPPVELNIPKKTTTASPPPMRVL